MPLHVPEDFGVDAERARETANGFLVAEVGDLLMAGEPTLTDGWWLVPIIAGNVVRGALGQVGSLRVHARTAELLFSEADRAQMRTRARRLRLPATAG